MHRKNVIMVVRTDGGRLQVLEIYMCPTKANQIGEREDQAVVVADGWHPKVSAGVLILAMEAQDEVVGDQSLLPLLRYARMGREIKETAFKRWRKDALRNAGLGYLATGGHGLRIGEATTVSEQRGLDAAHAEGGWRSVDMRRRYVHMFSRAEVRARLNMASEPGPELEKDKLPH